MDTDPARSAQRATNSDRKEGPRSGSSRPDLFACFLCRGRGASSGRVRVSVHLACTPLPRITVSPQPAFAGRLNAARHALAATAARRLGAFDTLPPSPEHSNPVTQHRVACDRGMCCVIRAEPVPHGIAPRPRWVRYSFRTLMEWIPIQRAQHSAQPIQTGRRAPVQEGAALAVWEGNETKWN